MSLLQKSRLDYRPAAARALDDLSQISLDFSLPSVALPQEIQAVFPLISALAPSVLQKKATRSSTPLKVGVFFSGGQAAGGHNVIAGLWDALIEINPDSKLIGFLDGPAGFISNRQIAINEQVLTAYRNQGGFDLLGSGRTKIETPEQFASALTTAEKCGLDGLLIIGGDDSNTNGALLAEYFLQKGCSTRVVGVPKTIDGDLQSADIEISFGFDSACKTYAEAIGNITRDACSAKKYTHFIKLMGRSASHIALECALLTHPNYTVIGEEGKTLDQIADEIGSLVRRRSEAGKDYGVILVPEGAIEFMPEIKKLIGELNELLAAGKGAGDLSNEGRLVFEGLPSKIQEQLTKERDPHGNVQVSLIETEYLLIEKVKQKLQGWKGVFHPVAHFFGYEGRSCLPSNFDANYCYALGRFAAVCIRDRATGVIASIQKLKQPAEKWTFKAVPLIDLMHFEMRKGKLKPVIRKALVDLQGGAFSYLAANRKRWEIEDAYQMPGPIQFFGDQTLTDRGPEVLSMSQLQNS